MGFKNKVISIVLTLSMALSVPMCAYAEGQSAPGPDGEAPATSAQSAPSAQKALEPAEDAHDEAPAPSAEEQAQAGIAVAREEVAEVSYVLIARPEMTTSDDQLIVVGFSDDTRVAESATLELVDEATGDALSVELDNAVAGALLFKVAGADLGEGAYRIASLEFAESDAREAKKVSFREDAQNVYRFFVETDLGQGADAAEGDAVRAFTLNDEGALEARDSVSAALDAAAGVQVLSTAADPASARDGDLVVALDAGHGGRDGGAQGDGLSEKDLTLKIAKYCKAELERYSGVRVVMTRSGDFYVGLSERVRYAVSQGADVFVSLHINSSTNSSAHGAEVIIPNDSSYLYEEVHVAGKELAEKILAQITGLGLTERDIYWSDSTSGETFPDGSIADYFTVIDEAHWAGIPGIIVEHAFVSNPKDAAFLGNEDNLRALGVADAKGIAAQYGLGVGKWVLGEDGRWRWYEGSTMVTNAWRTIGGDTLWFGADGVAVRGWFEIGGKEYYFSPESAALQRGWLDLNGKRYRLDRDDGHLWTGFYTVDGVYYYSDPDGAMRRGWLDLDGKRYRLDRDDGHLWTGDLFAEGSWYHADADGALVIGWLTGSSGSRFYYDPARGGALAIGWFDADGRRYFAGDDGAMRRGWLDHEGKRYRLDRDDGHLWTGFYTVDGIYYYSDPGGAMRRGWLDLDGKRYRLDRDDGHLWTGDLFAEGSWYHADADGALVIGWLTGSSGSRFYYDPARGGALAIGWFDADGRRYFAGDDGAMRRGWLDHEGKRYRLDRDDGHLWTGDLFAEGSWYHADADGALVIGWLTGSSGSRFYYDPARGGALAIGWFDADGRRYFAGDDGAMRRGWLDHEGKRYRLDRDDGHLWTGWYTVDDKWYYSNDEGVLMTGWVLDGAYYHYYGKGETFFPYKSQELYYVSGSRYASADSLIAAFKASGARYPAAELARGGAGSVEEFCRIVYEESVAEGIRPQVVFCQAMLETGWLRFGGDVSIGQFNFAGLGAVGSGAAGASFPDVRTGIRAQVQHLKAYANNEALNNACVDPRFSYVTRGVSEYVQWLGIPNNPTGKGWAATDGYGMNIVSMIEQYGLW